MTDEALDILIKRALGQTYKSGSEYAAVPYPWWRSFCESAGQGWLSTDVPWSDLCQFTRRTSDEPEILICMLPKDHDGLHGCDPRRNRNVTTRL